MNRSKLFSLLVILAFVFVAAAIAQNPTDETVTCPVSGKVIKKSEAKGSAEYQGKTYYFCCEGCKKEFLKDPEKYAQKQTEMKAIYTCPMHPDVRSDKPGKCSKCGMDLQKKTMMPHGHMMGEGEKPCCPEMQGARQMGMGMGMMHGDRMAGQGRMPHGRGMMIPGGWLMASKDLEMSVENTADGAVIKLSSKNPDFVKIIQGHAAMMKVMREKSQACCPKDEVKKEDVKK
jgi:YHS domain-containing protein/ssDNA-binding Zn-finger/Zn-ribbon topoisomerase 1